MTRETGRARGVLLVVGTLLAMAASAGVGAFIAARSEGRDTPGIGAPEPTGEPTRTQAPADEGERWRGTIVSRTEHAYRTGGTCTTDWRTELDLSVDPGGSVSGDAKAKLTAGPECPFPVLQPQIDAYGANVTGALTGKGFRLRLTDWERVGSGTTEYGGFELTMVDHPRPIEVPLSGERSGHARFALRYSGVAGEDLSSARSTIRMTRAGA